MTRRTVEMEYRRLSEKMSEARRHLMLPHLKGEEQSIADALIECSAGLRDVTDEELDDHASACAKTIRAFLDAAAGGYAAKAAGYTPDEKISLGNAVDELASWATFKFYEPTSV